MVNPDKVKDMSNVLSMEKRIQHNARLLSYATDKDCTIMTVVIIIFAQYCDELCVHSFMSLLQYRNKSAPSFNLKYQDVIKKKITCFLAGSKINEIPTGMINNT